MIWPPFVTREKMASLHKLEEPRFTAFARELWFRRKKELPLFFSEARQASAQDKEAAIRVLEKIEELNAGKKRVFYSRNGKAFFEKKEELEHEIERQLIHFSKDQNQDVQSRAIFALGKGRHFFALNRLKEETKNESGMVKEYAIDALAKIGHPSCLFDLERALDDQQEHVSLAAAKAIFQIARETKEYAIKAINTEHDAVGQAALKEMEKTLDLDFTPHVLNMIQKAYCSTPRDEAERLLQKLCEKHGEKTQPYLIKVLEKTPAPAAFEEIGKVGNEKAIPTLLSAVEKTSGKLLLKDEHQKAVWALDSVVERSLEKNPKPVVGSPLHHAAEAKKLVELKKAPKAFATVCRQMMDKKFDKTIFDKARGFTSPEENERVFLRMYFDLADPSYKGFDEGKWRLHFKQITALQNKLKPG